MLRSCTYVYFVIADVNVACIVFVPCEAKVLNEVTGCMENGTVSLWDVSCKGVYGVMIKI